MAYTFKHGDRPLDGYTIQRGIGRGGFGEVYYAISDGGREVALKYLRDNAEIELRGVTHCMNLKSPHLVSIFDVKKSADGEYFIIMEHIAGPSLCELLIAEPSGLGVEKAAYFLREIGRGLAYLHDRGIVHRDMKPANIFYEDGHVKIGDYGLSKFISVSRHSAQTTSIGTVHYMAPEVGSGNYHRGIDIYALGVILYEMLLGRVPFEGSSMGEVLMKHLTEQPEVTGLPEPFGKVIRKALEKDPKDRYQNVNEMIDDMLEVGDVRNSLAGFNPNSIASMPRRAMADTMPTPIPSPNPVPRHAAEPHTPIGQPQGVPVAIPLPKDVGKRLQRVNDKVSRKMDALAGRPHRRRRQRHPALATTPANDMGAFPRFALMVIVTLGIGVATGMTTGLIADEPLVGASSGMMIGGVAIGLAVCGKLLFWFGAGAQPKWVKSIVAIGCCAPLMTIASLPLLDLTDEAPIVLLGCMAGMLFFADISGRFESGARGEFGVGSAINLGLWGLICGSIASWPASGAHPEGIYAVMGAGIGAGLSLVLQAMGWLTPGQWVNSGVPATVPDSPGVAQVPPSARFPIADDSADFDAVPLAIPVEAGTTPSGYASAVPLRPVRSGFARGFWSLFTFSMLFGMIATILFAALVRHDCKDDLLALIIGSVACGSLMLFSAQKLTLRKRRGFWRETGFPLSMAMAMTAMGACISILAVQPLHDDEFAAAVTGIVVTGLVLLLLLAARVGLLRSVFGGRDTARAGSTFIVAAGIGDVNVDARVTDDGADG